jgi:NitT/TauT family transport system substrate-binding protein
MSRRKDMQRVCLILGVALAVLPPVRSAAEGPRAPAGPTTAPGAPRTVEKPYPPTAPATRPSGQIVLQMHWQPQAQFAGCMMAQEKGFFTQAGLTNVVLEWAGAAESPLDRLAAGETDFCTGWLSQAIRKRVDGANIVEIAQIMQKSAMMLVARADSGIAEPKDMTGKRVGLWGGDFDVQPKAFFARYGIRPVVVEQSTSMVPFLRGAVAVASAMQYNEYHKLMEAGLRQDELKVFAFSDCGIDFPEDGVYCTQATRDRRPEVCVALVSAIIRGWAEAFSDESRTLDVVMRYCAASHVDTNRNHQQWMLRSMRPLIEHRVGKRPADWGRLTNGEYAKVTRILIDQGLIREAPGFEAFYRPADLATDKP